MSPKREVQRWVCIILAVGTAMLHAWPWTLAAVLLLVDTWVVMLSEGRRG